MYTKISQIRAKHANTLLVNTGDTIQGSAEVLFTRGQAIVDVLNRFSIDAYAMGNWDWVYGVDRALELFAGPAAKAPWNAVAANVYYDGEPYAIDAQGHILAGKRAGDGWQWSQLPGCATSISVGEIVSSAKATQQVPALAAGSYFFRCDVHKEMTGTINAK